MKKFFLFTLVFMLLFPGFTYANADLNIEADSAILYNPDTKEILFEKNADAPVAPASLTKVMTLLIVSEEMKKRGTKDTELVTISEKAWRTQGSLMFLNVGAKVPIGELKKGLAIVSGNDAAVALAEYFYGSTEEFIKVMNNRAKELGMKNTHFKSVNGLSEAKDGDKSSARDLMILTDFYMSHFPENMKLHQTPSYTTPKEYHGGQKDIPQESRNPLLKSYKGGTGLKTGMIEGHFNLIGTAERDHIKLISVIMKSPSSGARERSAFRLLDFGFAQYKSVTNGKKGDEIKTLNVYKSSNSKSAKIFLKEDATIVVNVKDESKIKVKDKVPSFLEGGYKAGDKIGERNISVGDKKYSFDIIVKEDIKEAPWYIKFLDQIAILFNKLIEML